MTALPAPVITPLFVGLTRQPMVLGVSHAFFVVSFLPCLMVLVLTKALVVTSALYAVCHAIGVVGCLKDERFFDLVLGKLLLSCPNRRYWGCVSYDPY